MVSGVSRSGVVRSDGSGDPGIMPFGVLWILVPNTQSPSPYDIEDIRYIRGVLYAL